MKLEITTENSRPSSLYVKLNFLCQTYKQQRGKKEKKKVAFQNLTDKHVTSLRKQTGLQFPPPKSEHKSTETFKFEIFQTSKSCSNKKHFHNYLTTLKIY